MRLYRFAFAVAAAGLVAATPASAADVTVTITGVKARGGTMLVALYDDATFLRAKPPYAGEAKVTAAGDLVVTIRGVAAGDYAVSAFHDANDDRRMTMGADGRIGEGTALSNAAALRGPPSFAVNKVAVPATGTVLTIAMSYPEDRTGW